MKIKKKYKILTVLTLVLLFFFWGGIELNNKIEWKMTEDLIATGAMPTQIGLINVVETFCIPSCQTPAGVAACCGPPVSGASPVSCVQVIPGNGTFESTCPLFSAVSGLSTGGTGGNGAILSRVAMSQAGLTPGGQFIYGGTTNNMSLSAGGVSNSVLASNGGCFGCYAQNESKWKQKFAVAKDMFMAIFKD